MFSYILLLLESILHWIVKDIFTDIIWVLCSITKSIFSTSHAIYFFNEDIIGWRQQCKLDIIVISLALPRKNYKETGQVSNKIKTLILTEWFCVSHLHSSLDGRERNVYVSYIKIYNLLSIERVYDRQASIGIWSCLRVYSHLTKLYSRTEYLLKKEKKCYSLKLHVWL